MKKITNMQELLKNIKTNKVCKQDWDGTLDQLSLYEYSYCTYYVFCYLLTIATYVDCRLLYYIW